MTGIAELFEGFVFEKAAAGEGGGELIAHFYIRADRGRTDTVDRGDHPVFAVKNQIRHWISSGGMMRTASE